MSPQSSRTPSRRADDIQLALISQDLKYIKEDMHDIKTTLTSGYVTKEEFQPVKNLVYGLVGLVLVAVVGALLTLVVK